MVIAYLSIVTCCKNRNFEVFQREKPTNKFSYWGGLNLNPIISKILPGILPHLESLFPEYSSLSLDGVIITSAYFPITFYSIRKYFHASISSFWWMMIKFTTLSY